MAAVMRGDGEALGTLVERHHSELLGYLYRMIGGDRPLAEDLVQEVFVRLLTQRSYVVGKPFKPWLYAIATNLVRDQRRAIGRRSPEEREELARNVAGSRPGPDEQAVAAAWQREVADAVLSLGEEYRRP